MKSKNETRKRLVEEQGELDGNYISESDIEIFRRITELSEYKNAGTVFVYRSFGREADTRRIIERSAADRKRVAVPVTQRGEEPYFTEYPPPLAVAVNCRGIMSADKDAERVEPDRDDIMIIPGVAFDERGYRLGRGGGYYDRYLADRRCFKTGVCRDRFFVGELPVEPHDVRMDCVVTDKRVVRFGEEIASQKEDRERETNAG